MVSHYVPIVSRPLKVEKSSRKIRKVLTSAEENTIIRQWTKAKIAVADVKTWKYCSFTKLLAHHHTISRCWNGKFATDFVNLDLMRIGKQATIFCGYEHLTTTNARLITLLTDQFTPSINLNQATYLIVDKTPFFPSGGGQEHDIGNITFLLADNRKINRNIVCVTNKQNVFLHQLAPASDNTLLELNNPVKLILTVDKQHRQQLARNHSATHLLHQTVKRIFGARAIQKGSSISDICLRFDFNCHIPSPRSRQTAIDIMVNQQIRKALSAIIVVDSLSNIQKNTRIEKNFLEHYPAHVRTIRFGNFSYEVCSGTHVTNTSEIEAFLITKFYRIGSQIMRIRAVTGWDAVYSHYNKIFNDYHTIWQANNQYLPTSSLRKKFLITHLSKENLQHQFGELVATDYFAKFNARSKTLIKLTRQAILQTTQKNDDNIQKLAWLHLKTHHQTLSSGQNFYHFITLNASPAQIIDAVAMIRNINHYKHLFTKTPILFFAQQKNNCETIQLVIYTGLNSHHNPKYHSDALQLLRKITTTFNGRGGGNKQLARGTIKNSLFNIKTLLEIVDK